MRVEPAANRLAYLDGLRGLAALTVAFAHFFAAFVPSLQFGSDFSQRQNWQAAFAASGGYLLINGSFSVYIFKVLSGFVISGASERSSNPLYNLIVARFLRLNVLAAFAVGIAMILFEFKALNLHLIDPLFDCWWIKLNYKPDVLHFANQYGDLLGRYILRGHKLHTAILDYPCRALCVLRVFCVFPFFN